MSNGKFVAVSGQQYWVNGEIEFPPPDLDWRGVRQDGALRTYFGWNFAHSGVIYRKSDLNFKKCLRRMTCVREPETPGADLAMRHSQERFIGEHGNDIRRAFLQSFGHIDWANTNDIVATAKWLKEQPHEKKPLRMQTYEEWEDSGGIATKTWLHNDCLLFKMKTAEIAKPGKYPRLICDLGCAASLQGAVYAEMLKKHISNSEFVYGDTVVEFCGDPSPENVGRLFRKMFESNYKRYIIMFSDDACMCVNENGKRRFYNLDISSCDASHTRSIFDLMFTVSEAPTAILEALRGQIEANIRIVSCDGRFTVILKAMSYYLQSGITITTVLNCFAQFLMGVVFEMDDVLSEDDIIKSARRVGYIVTLDSCTIPEDLQFLKMSPTLNSEGEWTACLNLGVILKCSGTCKSDLPGKGSWAARAAQFQTGLMRGVLSGINYPPFERLNPNMEGLDTRHLKGLVGLLDMLQGAIGMYKMPYLREDFYRRYRLEDWEIDELESHIAQQSYGMRSYSSAGYKIIEKDYKLGKKPSDMKVFKNQH